MKQVEWIVMKQVEWIVSKPLLQGWIGFPKLADEFYNSRYGQAFCMGRCSPDPVFPQTGSISASLPVPSEMSSSAKSIKAEIR